MCSSDLTPTVTPTATPTVTPTPTVIPTPTYQIPGNIQESVFDTTGTSSGSYSSGTTTPTYTVPTAPELPPQQPVTPVVTPEPLKPLEPVNIPPDSSVVPNVDVTTPTTPVTPYVPIVTPTTPTTPTDTTHYGRFTMGQPIVPNVAQGLNPGYITNVPTFYKNTTPAQAQFYWGGHPFQPGPTFDPVLYNQIPNAPVQPWGASQIMTSATPQQILQQMGYLYPLVGSTTMPIQP